MLTPPLNNFKLKKVGQDGEILVVIVGQFSDLIANCM